MRSAGRHDDETVIRIPTKQELATKILAEDRASQERALTSGLFVGEGVVVEAHGTVFHVEISGEVLRLPLHPAYLGGGLPLVGDVVVVTEQSDQQWITRIQPRRTSLARRDVETGQHQHIVANIDVIAIVVSVGSPPLHPKIIDRYLIAIRQGGAIPVLFVNKTDCVPAEDLPDELEKLTPYQRAGFEIHMGSAAQGRGLDGLRQVLQGKTSAFVGHSGVGKSSLLNALCPEIGADTGSVSSAYGRGTHTTTSSSRHLIAPDTYIIDTPGIRSFALAEVEPDELARFFPEFEPFVDGCKFRDCLHMREPKCAVKQAVEDGLIPAERYEFYMQMQEEMA